MKSEQNPSVTYLNDYQPPVYRVETVDLAFDLHEDHCTVQSRLQFQRQEGIETVPLQLNGCELELLSLTVDGEPLSTEHYRIDDDVLTITGLPSRFILETVCRIQPQLNTALEGLYKSGGMFCTQCEAEGFRRITYFPDRPDVMASYTTTITADKQRYPVLLSNGNLIDKGELEGGRHWTRWQDPFPKPSYLFALVAGDLQVQEDYFVTCSGRRITLQIFVEPANIDKCDHALASLKKAMRWDEERYGREYDLDIFMIVAVNDFNMGAMENKGLNIFNSACVLAKPETATDADYDNIEGIIGHEYFHNWSGNRVTCRDWFQLSLKEGFTVFRDQEFSADMGSRAVKRIADVNVLRTAQFTEDAGPMAHAVRPDSYIDISNFYTVTVYNKGAEVVRMIHHLLGAERFRAACDLYFERHDGQAVTVEDFVRAMEEAAQVDLGQFQLWYRQAGTPELVVSRSYDPDKKIYRLTLAQQCLETPGQKEKTPFHIPVAIGLLGADGKDIPLRDQAVVSGNGVIELTQPRQQFEFHGIDAEPVPSILRAFSAPVKVTLDYHDDELMFLMMNDSDSFNRWEAGQLLAARAINRQLENIHQGRPLSLDENLVQAYGKLLDDRGLDPALVAQSLTLPNERYLAEQQAIIDPLAIHQASVFVYRQLAEQLFDKWLRVYHDLLTDEPYQFNAQAMARRSLKNLCLRYLNRLDSLQCRELAMSQFGQANNMTDRLAALSALMDGESDERNKALSDFYQQWQHDPLVVDKWFGLQARADKPTALDDVLRLMEHPAFEIKNPNKVRALIAGFCMGNPAHFHAIDGKAYRFLADQVLTLNALNPQMSARLATGFSQWRRYDATRQDLMKAELQRIEQAPDLSKDVYEIVLKSLN